MDEPGFYLPAHDWEAFSNLPPAWGSWEEGWKFFKRLELQNPASVARENEPIEVEVEFHAGQASDLERELRVVEVVSAQGPLREVPSQIHGEEAEGEVRRGRLFFIGSLGPEERKTYLILYGNPAATRPAYETDLKASGEEYALDIENQYYRVALARTSGHLKSVSFKEGRASFSGFGPPMSPGTIGSGRHGVEGSVHWNPDWSDERTGRYRVTNWPVPPHYAVLRGPICVRVERWGHPILALGPDLGQSRAVVARIAYTFYAGVPYFLMESRLDVLEDVRFRDCRNDEWVGMSPSMPDIAWMGKEGEIGFGRKSWQRQDPAWISFFNRENSDGFATLHVDYECTHPHWSEPASVATTERAWVRYPLRNAIMRAGDFVREKNAYLVHRYEPGRDCGFGMLMDYHARLRQPLLQEDAPLATKPLTLPNVMDALRACRDLEIYVKGEYDSRRTPGVVDLGLVREVEICGDAVHIAMIMPYEGRETWFDWFVDTMEAQIRQRVQGVGEVRVELVRTPVWTPARMSPGARKLLGL